MRTRKPSDHVADLKTSKRLQKLLRFMYRRGEKGATTGAIFYFTRICGIPQAIHELRANGCKINCVFERSTRAGTRVYRHTLVKVPAAALTLVK